MSKPSILLVGDLAHTNKEWESLSAKYSLKEFRQGSREQFLSKLKSDFSDVVGLYRSNQSTSETGPFDQELVSQLPKSLKFICHNGAGYDNIDVEAVNDRQISVSSTPVAVDNATADVGIFLMLGALRQAHVSYTALHEGKWRGGAPLGHDPRDKVLGVLGMGGIGRALAHRARAFGCKIIYHNRSRLSPELEGGATYVSFDELLAQSDILSLNLALNPKTKHIISAPQLAKCKKGVVIINTARGGLINEAELVDALESGQVSAVGLDVFEEEPKIHPGLVKNDRAFLMPHMGTWTVETQRDMELLVLKNLETGMESGKLITRIAEQKGLPWAKDDTSKL
ncbi:hypothetical protein LTR70_001636 [Exophiala xenobiotica]|uniref:Uncharacterized protein n=1 Tax=Lithohypha guttulata TaxID=1690604 RepID=A0ABR0KHK4_9EURO|nr:hypothetical protein LTR24_002527 [Lithohypha guttulata]KAK5327162.1 hypothetical protein LTR70_001636 [Exophiala xenobiotica]